jgi:hypothetical protein
VSLVCYCGAETKVVDTREKLNRRLGAYVHRRRVCANGHSYNSIELPTVLVEEMCRQFSALNDARAMLLAIAGKTIPFGKAHAPPVVPGPRTPRGLPDPILNRCRWCKQRFVAKKPFAKYCSAECRRAVQTTREKAARHKKRKQVIEVRA